MKNEFLYLLLFPINLFFCFFTMPYSYYWTIKNDKAVLTLDPKHYPDLIAKAKIAHSFSPTLSPPNIPFSNSSSTLS